MKTTLTHGIPSPHCVYLLYPTPLLIVRIYLLRARRCWFLVPIFAPFLGAIIGVMVYQTMVGYHMEGEVRDRQEAQLQNERERLNSISTNDHNKEKEVS